MGTIEFFKRYKTLKQRLFLLLRKNLFRGKRLSDPLNAPHILMLRKLLSRRFYRFHHSSTITVSIGVITI